MKCQILLIFLLLIFLLFSSCKGRVGPTLEDFVHNLNMDIAINAPNQVVSKNFREHETVETTYLGSLLVNNMGKVYLFNTIHISNKELSPTHSNFVMLYTKKGKFIGHYYLNYTDQLPEVIKNNLVCFNKKCEGEEDYIVISFIENIPSAINLGCAETPDFYEFIFPE